MSFVSTSSLVLRGGGGLLMFYVKWDGEGEGRNARRDKNLRGGFVEGRKVQGGPSLHQVVLHSSRIRIVVILALSRVYVSNLMRRPVLETFSSRARADFAPRIPPQCSLPPHSLPPFLAD